MSALSLRLAKLSEKINRVAGKSTDVRKRKVVTTSPDGVKTTIEDVLPTHNDIAVFSKVLGLGTSVYSEEERQRDVLREVMKHKVAGKYSALEAAQLLEAEGVKFRQPCLWSWKHRRFSNRSTIWTRQPKPKRRT